MIGKSVCSIPINVNTKRLNGMGLDIFLGVNKIQRALMACKLITARAL